MDAQKYDEILKVELKYRHLDNFSDGPVTDAVLLYAFGRANHEYSKDEACVNRAIDYYERSKERMDAWRTQTPMIDVRLKMH